MLGNTLVESPPGMLISDSSSFSRISKRTDQHAHVMSSDPNPLSWLVYQATTSGAGSDFVLECFRFAACYWVQGAPF